MYPDTSVVIRSMENTGHSCGIMIHEWMPKRDPSEGEGGVQIPYLYCLLYLIYILYVGSAWKEVAYKACYVMFSQSGIYLKLN